MPRVAKIKSKIYHIISKGINQQDIFSVAEDYEKTITILSKYRKKSEYEIYAYCLMESHFLLLIKEGINLIFSIVISSLKVLNISDNGCHTIT